ncbi:MAG: hypothetical protein EOP11_13905 [Proteobacteria bacterium]|nr:MAG: hypothetical protein EOP11_13905 [Pseudomonadota bacterium]
MLQISFLLFVVLLGSASEGPAHAADSMEQILSRLHAPADPELARILVPASRDLLIRMPEPTPAEAQTRNEAKLKEAREILWARPNLAPGRESIKEEEAKEIFEAIRVHPVATLSALPKYDPLALMKLCYGRAMAVQLEAVIARGVAADSVRKVWAVGNLTAKWATNFHVAAMIKGPAGEWFVIDLNQDGPMKLPDWFAQIKRIDNTQRPNLEILFTDGDRLLERRNQVYSPELLRISQWRGYFVELIDSYASKP